MVAENIIVRHLGCRSGTRLLRSAETIRSRWYSHPRSESIELLTTRLLLTTESGVLALLLLLLLLGRGLQNGLFVSTRRRNIAYAHANLLQSAVFHTAIQPAVYDINKNKRFCTERFDRRIMTRYFENNYDFR